MYRRWVKKKKIYNYNKFVQILHQYSSSLYFVDFHLSQGFLEGFSQSSGVIWSHTQNNPFLQVSHTVGFSPVWALLVCCVRLPLHVKALPHVVQLKASPPVWILVCFTNGELHLNSVPRVTFERLVVLESPCYFFFNEVLKTGSFLNNLLTNHLDNSDKSVGFLVCKLSEEVCTQSKNKAQ